jgi:rhodanese-related sulfurtransferase
MQKIKFTESQALLTGLGLIVLVVLVTVYKAGVFSFKSEKAQGDDDITAEKTLGYETILTKDLSALLAKKAPVKLIDIRSFDDYIAEHILDSKNLTPDELQATTELSNDEPIVLIAATGDDPNISRAVDILKKKDIKNFKVLAGGMLMWVSQTGNTITYGDPNSFQDQAKVEYLTPEQLRDKINNKENLFIIDIRSEKDFATEHLPGAINIPFEKIEQQRDRLISTRKPTVIGANEIQEFQASVQIYDMLLTRPYVVRGGFPKWKESNLQLTK